MDCIGEAEAAMWICAMRVHDRSQAGGRGILAAPKLRGRKYSTRLRIHPALNKVVAQVCPDFRNPNAVSLSYRCAMNQLDKFLTKIKERGQD
jgi:hypothetical protein